MRQSLLPAFIFLFAIVSINISMSIIGTLFVEVTSQDATDCDNPNGTATANPSEGVEPYTYEWSTGDTAQTIDSLGQGSVTVTVTDADGNTAVANAFQGPIIFPNLTTTPQTECSDPDGSISSAPTGGTPPYFFLWSTGDTTSSINGLTAGNHSVTITDSVGWTANQATTVPDNTPNIIISSVGLTPATTCNPPDGGANINSVVGGTPPYTFQWENGDVGMFADSLFPGPITVTDADGCIKEQIFTIPGTIINLELSSTPNTSCNGPNGTAKVSISGGLPPYFITWSNGSNDSTAVGLAAGDYTLTVTDSDGCPREGSVTISDSYTLSVSIPVVSPRTSCNNPNGSAIAEAEGGVPPYDFSWSNGAQSQINSQLDTGLYSVTVTDNAGCTVTSAVVITFENDIAVETTSTKDTGCTIHTGTATAHPSGGNPGYTYSWNSVPPQTTQTAVGLEGSTYTVTVTDVTGCTATSEVVIFQEPSEFTTSLTVFNNTSCGLPTGQITALPIGGVSPHTYLWSTGSNNATILQLAGGSYTVTVTDALGFTAMNIEEGVVLDEPAQITVEDSVVHNTTCVDIPNGSIGTFPDGGEPPYTYEWDSGQNTSSISGLIAGLYRVTVTDANECTARKIFSIADVPVEIDITLSTTSNTNCDTLPNGSAIAIVKGGTPPYIYKWIQLTPMRILADGPSNNTSELKAGDHRLEVTDQAGCRAIINFFIIPEQITVTASSTPDSGCLNPNGSFLVSVHDGTPPYQFFWQQSITGQNPTDVNDGMYRVTVVPRRPRNILIIKLIHINNQVVTGFVLVVYGHGNYTK